jgi:hypothetical protein
MTELIYSSKSYQDLLARLKSQIQIGVTPPFVKNCTLREWGPVLPALRERMGSLSHRTASVG